MSKSPFAQIAPALLAQGYSPIPIIPGTKRPAAGPGWSRYCDGPADKRQIAQWAAQDGLGVGVALGNGTLAVDIDSEDPAVQAAIIHVIGAPLVAKRGQRGFTAFVREPTLTASPRKIRAANATTGMLAEVLGRGQQTVIPPTVHPETGAAYAWTSERTLIDTPAAALPVVPADIVDRLAEALRPWTDRGIERAAEALQRASAQLSVAPAGRRNDDLFRQARALADDVRQGRITEQAVNDTLLAACGTNGLLAEEGDAPCRATIASGLKGRGSETNAPYRIARLVISQDEAARLFVDRHDGEMLFDSSRGAWLLFRDGLWRIDNQSEIQHRVRQHCREIDDANRPKLGSASAIAGVERLARSDPRVAAVTSQFDAQPFVLGTPGAYVDLRTGADMPPDPTLKISQSTIVARESGAPAQWLAFLDQATGGNQELVDFLQRVFGYCATGDTREHALFFVYGKGGTGKSTLVNTMQEIFGTYARSAPMEMLTASRFDRHPTEIAMLQGRRLIVATETEQGRLWAEAKIKQLTGGDRVAARFMHRDFFEFDPAFKLVIVGNHAPALASPDESVRRRFNIVPFTHAPEIRDMQLIREAGRILNWVIEGAVAWQQYGLAPPPLVVSATDTYFEHQDVIADWFEAECVLDLDLSDTCDRLYRSYAQHMRGIGERPMTAKGLGHELGRRGFKRVHLSSSYGRRSRGWRGLKALN
ncbi:MAG: phage/plasmid primase, P4 family [Hyphomicrobiaceae bacterium]